MTTSRLLHNRKGNTLVFQSVMLGVIILGFFLFTQAMKQDGYYNDYVSTGVSEGQEPSLTSTGFFSNIPVFIGLPAWVLSIYAILGLWGILLVMAWIRGAS